MDNQNWKPGINNKKNKQGFSLLSGTDYDADAHFAGNLSYCIYSFREWTRLTRKILTTYSTRS